MAQKTMLSNRYDEGLTDDEVIYVHIGQPRLVETPDMVGLILCRERERNQKSLADVSSALRIKPDFLKAIETCRYGDLPGATYARGFVRDYANYLQLDARQLVEQLDGEMVVAVEDRAPGLVPPVLGRSFPKGGLMLAALVALVAIFGTWLLSQSGNHPVDMAEGENVEAQILSRSDMPVRPVRGRADLAGDAASAATEPFRPVLRSDGAVGGQAATDAEGNPQVVPGIPKLTDVVAPVVPAPFATQEEADMANADIAAMPVTIRATRDKAWLRVEDSRGHVLIERELANGESYTLPDRPGLIMVARDADAFDLLVRGQEIGRAGPRGVVLTGKPLDPQALLLTAKN